MPKSTAHAIAYSLSLIIEDARDSGLTREAIEGILTELRKLGVGVADVAEVEHFLIRIMAINT